MDKLIIGSKTVEVKTFKVNATFSTRMVRDLNNFKSIDYISEELMRKEVYAKRKRIIDNILKDFKTNDK